MNAGRRDGVAPVLVLAVVLLLPAVALFGLWQYAASRAEERGEPLPPTTAPAAAVAPTPALDTPLLSFRRLPGLIARNLNDDAFAGAVNSFGSSLDATSCLAVQLDGFVVGAHNPDVPVIPASNQKLVTAAAALHVLGADHTFTTELRASAVSGGVVSGDLYLVGGGDPLLTTNDFLDEHVFTYPVINPTSLDDLADAVVAAGITQVEGSVVGDGSRYDDEWFQPNWGDGIRLTEAGPVSALLVNDARFFDGEWKVANDPNAGAAVELKRLLVERGVTVAGESASGTAPDGTTVVASIQSQPLPAVIAEMQATSDNNTSEMLVKEMGLRAGDGPTTAAGSAVVLRAVAELGIDTTGFVVADGSGLSNDNRVTCGALAAMLGRYQPGDQFAAGLPVAGQSGTLSDTFTDSSVAGRLAAKTGTLGNPPYNADPPAVKALSGYLPVDGGGTIQFAFIMNSAGTLADQGVYRPIWDRFADMLSTYPAGPSAAELGPR